MNTAGKNLSAFLVPPWRQALVVTLLLPGLQPPGDGAPVRLRVLFADDFTGGAFKWQPLTGKWVVEKGEYVSTAPGMSVAGEAAWKDYALEVRLKTGIPGRGSWAVGGLIFRFTRRDNTFGGDYYYVLLHQRNNLEVGKRVGGKQVKGGLSHVRDVPPATYWNTLRVEVRGGFIQVFVNGELKTQVVDSNPLPQGKIGLLNLGARRCRFAAVRVTRVGEVGLPPVHPWPGQRYWLNPPAAESPAGQTRSWSTYRGDNQRSGVAGVALPMPLKLNWTYVPRQPPRPAWPEPGKETQRMDFDYVYHLTVAGGLAFFGSSADHQVHALDLRTGRERWRFFTEGPVRFAPTVAGNRVFAGSDDGWVYCLSAVDGSLLWKFRGGPHDERLLGNGQMISRWPVRTGVLVDQGIVYFAAGMWSSDGVYVYALRAEDGSVVWKNDTCGRRYMKLPHDYLEGIAGVSPQGYLLLCRDTLIVPNGRAMPAGFDSATGKLRFCRNDASKLHHAGGSWLTASGDLVLGERRPLQIDGHVRLGEADPLPGDGLIAWTYDTGEQVFALAGKHRVLVHGGIMYTSGDGKLTATETRELRRRAGGYYASGLVDPRLAPEHVHPLGWWRGARYPWYPSKVVPIALQPSKWETPLGRTYELILAGNVLVAGGRGQVTAVAADTGKILWQTKVEGEARGLAVTDSNLLVSTTTGRLLCYGKPTGNAAVVQPQTHAPADRTARPDATGILTRTRVRSGYCLLLGADGPLASELARQSKLRIYCLEPGAGKAAAARRLLDAAGIYGTRVAVHRGTFDRLPYADYFADLVVADSQAVARRRRLAAELYRVVRPWGGRLYVRATEGVGDLSQRFAAAGVPRHEVHVHGRYLLIARGPLPGAGEWTHEYADAGRSAATTDRYVRLPLKMLWFGGPGPARMVSRHWRSPTPLVANGRMFVAGENHVIAVDAYTGRQLWVRDLPGVAHFPAKYRGGNLVADHDSVYAAVGTRCLRLDAATGATRTTYSPPVRTGDMPVVDNPLTTARSGRAKATPVPNKRDWEFLAVTGDLLLGSVGVPNLSMSWWPEAYPECKYLFALHKADGSPAWVYAATDSVSPTAVVVRDRRVWLLDRTSRAQIARSRRRGDKHPVHCTLKSLSLRTGAVLWQQPVAAALEQLWSGDGVLLGSDGRLFVAWNAADGALLWTRPIRGGYPVILGDRFYVYPVAYDLRTGEQVRSTHPLTGESVPWRMGYKGGCGSLVGCPAALFYRSGATGMYDLAGDSGIHWLGQVRPSCWINLIPAGGLLLSAEGASNCTCPYNYQTSFALIADHRQENWSVFPQRQTAPDDRLRQVALNFGAVGDHRDAGGRLWLAFPRPFRPGALTVPLTTQGPVDIDRRDAEELAVTIKDRPWLYGSGLRGPVTAELDLLLHRPAVALPAHQPPDIDGRLTEACWDGRQPLPFTTDEQAADPATTAWLRTDADNLYLAFRRRAPSRNGKPVPWTAATRGRDARVWEDDSLNIRLRPGSRRRGLYLSLSVSGATFDGLARGRIGVDPSWDGAWTSAVHPTPPVWTAEVAVPWTTLRQAGLSRDNLTLYLESTNHSGVGPARVQFKYRPYTRLWCFAHPFVPVVFAPPPPGDLHTFRLTFHFFAPERLPRDRQVVALKIQGRTLVPTLIPSVSSPHTLTFTTRTQARDTLHLQLLPRTHNPPILSGMEVQEER